jgi:HTH-type transcriptional regulator, fmd operon transcriptional regulator
MRKGDHESQEKGDSLLTERQVRVLKLRTQGCSQQEIADILGTTRSNISIVERRAHRNISRAKLTIHTWLMIQAPLSVRISAGTDLFDLPNIIFAAADQRGIQLPITSPDIIVQLKSKAPNIFKNRNIKKDADIYVAESGDILVQEL